jgi:hypothetical protein
VIVKTHKAVPLQEIVMTSQPLDKNNEMKFAFLSHETSPDYRSVDVSEQAVFSSNKSQFHLQVYLIILHDLDMLTHYRITENIVSVRN